eukprot:TRINITY_DN3544_c1_g2_i1.p1 TRINITY_DN3544_c1_g2~~TRINITY_DN3544_c1_g2_i1.p1  ORF type:complete len:345 (+),score=82.75 TRINITY_DN3544_c1_g2_i1:113-1147(+)
MKATISLLSSLFVVLLLCAVRSSICEETTEPILVKWLVGNPLDAGYAVQLNKILQMAVDTLNSDDTILEGAIVELVKVPLLNSNSETENLRIASEEMMNDRSISAIVGTYSSNVTNYLVMLSSMLKATFVGSSPTLPKFSDKTEYPYFGRAISSGYDSTLALADFIALQSFKRVAFIASNDVFGLGLKDIFIDAMDERNIQLIGAYVHPALEDTPYDDAIVAVDALLTDLVINEGARAIMHSAQYDEIQLLVWRAYKLGFLEAPFNVQFLFHICHVIDVPCPNDECESDRPNFLSAMKGAVCAGINYEINDDWFNGPWAEAVSPEKLTAEEIAVRGVSRDGDAF